MTRAQPPSGTGDLPVTPLPDPTLPPSAPGVIRIDLAALVANWRALGARLSPGVGIGAVVKADGYGLGAVPVARALAAAGCRRFYVASPPEALVLAPALPAAEVVLFSGVWPGLAAALAPYPGIIPVLNNPDQIETWQAEAPGRPAMINLDSGMTRLGLGEPELATLFADPARLQGLNLVGIISHLACADAPDHPQNRAQLAQFRALSARFPGVPRSLAASSGIFLGPEFHFEFVRPGAAMYGINPQPGKPNPQRPVVEIEARIVQVREVEAGRQVGYGATWTASGPTRIATVALGYADGLPRSASNAAILTLGPHRLPLIGRVSMDLITVDVSSLAPEQIRPGGLLTLLGPGADVDGLAEAAGTIGYEVLTRLGRRCHRIYDGA